MKRLIALCLSIAMILTGCGQSQPQTDEPNNAPAPIEETEPITTPFMWDDVVPQYASLDDAELLAHVEDLVYRDTVASLNTDEYIVENVSAVYISVESIKLCFDIGDYVITGGKIWTQKRLKLSRMR